MRADVADKKVEIRVSGPEHTRRDFLTLLRAHFDVIHKTFTESAGKEAFPIRSWVCPPGYPGLRLEYEKLLTYERAGIREIDEIWQSRPIRLNVTAVLNGFSTPEARAEECERLLLGAIYIRVEPGGNVTIFNPPPTLILPRCWRS